MTTALTQLSGIQLPVSLFAKDQTAFGEMTKAGFFIPNLKLCSFNSSEVKEGKIAAGRYALVRTKDSPIGDLGDEVEAAVLGVRALALDTKGDLVKSYDHNSDTFKSIQNRADNETDSGCMYGPEFLLWVPGQGFTIFFCGNATLRTIGKDLRARIGSAATLKTRLIKKGKNSWHGAVVTDCSSFDASGMPASDVIVKEVERFNNPKTEAAETVKDTKKRAR